VTSLTELRLRPASEEDLDGLALLVARANATYREWAGSDWKPPGVAHERSRWRERFDDAAAWNVVAVSRRDVLGCASFTDARLDEGRGRKIAQIAHLSRMFVAPEHWGRGIGSLLLDQAVEEMRRRGYERAQLFTPTGNRRARRFYERHDWRLGKATRRWQGLLLVQYERSLSSRSHLE
jgi:GNAT superfamily N-acetyltransferase